MRDGLIDALDSWRMAGLAALERRHPSPTTSSQENSVDVASSLPTGRENSTQEPSERLNSVSLKEKGTVKEPPPEGHSQTLPLPSSAGGLPESLDVVAADVARCCRCVELARARTQTVFGSGNPRARLVFLGEAPGADEDAQGVPFVGRAGQLLTDIMTKGMGLTREEVYICNILRCRPPSNRTPLPEEASNCREFLDRTLALIAPKFICCLGTVAAQNLLGVSDPIGKMRGKVYHHGAITVVCTYHPAYLLRNPAAKRDTWADIQILMNLMEITTTK